MPNYYIGGGKGAYTHRHIERAKNELAEQAKNVEKPESRGEKAGEKAGGYYVTLQYLDTQRDNEPVNIRVFVWGNSRVNALHLSLNLPEVQNFILRAKDLGFSPDHFVVPSGLVSTLTLEGLVSKQGW